MLPSRQRACVRNATIVLLALSVCGFGQISPSGDTIAVIPRAQPPREAGPRATIRIDSTLVLIPVTVTDYTNRLVTGLEKENFRVVEDGADQQITQCSTEDLPISVGVVFDCSGSMGGKLQKSRMAVAQFFRDANPEDEFFLVQFNNGAKLIQPFTRDLEQIQNRLTFTQSAGQTALLDAVYLALQQMKKAVNSRKALLILSDGGDNNSRYSETEIKNLVKETDVQIYGIGIFEPAAVRARTPEELAGPVLLSEITEQTGGRQYPAESVDELPDIAAKIGLELRNQYILGYAPQNREHDGKYRRVQVRLAPPHGLPPLRASWRLGYYAPLQ
jgi:VWFA-related protein